MIQARKDGTSKEQSPEEKCSSSNAQQITTVHAVQSIDQLQPTLVRNTLGTQAVILSESSAASEGGNFQYHRLALGGQLQHVVTSVQVSGNSSTVLPESSLSVNPRCALTSTQDLTHILVATTTNSSLHTVGGLQNSLVNVSASTHQQFQTVGNLTNVNTACQRTKLEMGGTVLATQPVVPATVAQRIVLNSGVSDVYALRIAPSTMPSGTAQQQIMVIESSTGLVPSSDVTKVHSYSLPSAGITALPSASGMQKMIIGAGAGQVMHTSQKALLAATTHNQLKTAVKRPLVSPNQNRTEVTLRVNSSVNEVGLNLCVSNKLLTGSASTDSKFAAAIPNSPRPKKIKLEKSPSTNKDLLMKRKKMCDYLACKKRMLQIKYYSEQAEYFFLKNNGNMMDYLVWRKKIVPQLLEFLRATAFDHGDEMKFILDVLSRGPAMLFSASQGFTNDHALTAKSIANINSSHSQSPSTKLPTASSSSSQRLVGTSAAPAQTTVTKSVRQPLVTHKLSTKHNSISAVYDSQIGSQAEIVERARQEAYVLQRIGDLRKEGLWTLKRLPKIQESPRNKAHWDYLLEEMAWLATDFAQERKWKKAAAKKCARMITKYFQEKEIKAEKAEREEQMKLRKIAGFMAKEIKQFWGNIEKLVEYKQQTWLEEKRKKVLDVHLNFIVDQTEKYSSWLTQGMNRSFKGRDSSRESSPSHESKPCIQKIKQEKSDDEEFRPSDSETDDEETIKKEEECVDEVEQSEEVKLLQKESEMDLEDFLETLPPEILQSCGKLKGLENKSLQEENGLSQHSAVDDDDDFKMSSDEEDDEQTIVEQEKHEKEVDYKAEINDLKAESEMSIDELREKYSGAYVNDSQIANSEHSGSDDNDAASVDENSSEEDSSPVDLNKTDDTSFSETKDVEMRENNDENPSQEISDIAATAERFQPKGNTLSTTQVYTKVPFLLKHQLREYQHIGLDWLNAMYDKKLNGILADEMGLGKTIQTISLLAHLACEKGVWGPHLIVVPTSVMLNWEMEFKKWCPAFKILTYYGTPKERKQKRMGWTKPNAFHVCITSYKLVVQDHQSFRRKKWKYFILDEAQHIKNFKSQRWQMLLNFQSSHRLLLTGTPLQNNLMELWSLMHFLMPNVFQSHREFREWFVNPVTGMIEGNHEYNESLIKRLHKVLRPFLLRRLKSEVEKQLPKKYEHVVMCRLSKRQRYLYDDFMSQTKTKETLATGNFMSVINILMQLRKVCNHPNMFEERQTISPFLMEGITFHTASLVFGALDYDPFKHINLLSLNLLLTDLELTVSAFAAHRVMNFRTPAHLIEEIDSLPEPPPTCPVVKMRINFCNSHGTERSPSGPPQGRNIPLAHGSRLPAMSMARIPAQVGSSMTYPQRYMVIPGQHNIPTTRGASPVASVSNQPVIGQSQTGEYTLQLVPQPGSNVLGGQVIPSTHVTLQIQSTAQSGARLPVGGIQSLIGGIGRVVQTATGPHFVITSVSNPVTESQQASVTTSTTAVLATPGANSQSLLIGPNIATATVMPQVQKIGSPATAPFFTTVNRPQNNNVTTTTSSQTTHNKPIGRVAPLNVHPPISSSSSSGFSNQNSAPPLKGPVVHSLSKSHIRTESIPSSSTANKKNSLFYLESLAKCQEQAKKESLKFLAKINTRRCVAYPTYGKDLVEAVTVVDSLKHSTKGNLWDGQGYVNCLNAPHAEQDTRHYWLYTKALSEIILTPEKCVSQLIDIINRFVFVVPAVAAPVIELHVSHPSPSYLNKEKRRIEKLQNYISPQCALLHPVISNMKTQFPELRLIEYDCGKLQELAHLLRELKSNHHRVLIFTQMTRMLDILEQFLNYHGHTYLRLDGNTKVEQRQALMERFNADKRIFCFILSTRSGGIGVNLTGADTVIFYDSDWNPTMDAQAQDRCHRIGQTRDVHIYRLISTRTIEENILKKANQKRILGDLAIEGGNFTTAFFKKNTIHDLFGIDFQEEFARQAMENKLKMDESATEDSLDKLSQLQLEQALGMAEEESDKQAAQTAHAEAAAEFAEFDESIPLDNDSRDVEEKSPAEEELDKLMEQLTPVEKYAMQFLESLQEPLSLEQLKLAEEEIEAQKKDWELGHLKALKEEEERRSGLLDDDDPLLCYSRIDANQIYYSEIGQEEMPIWAPPTPPTNENDIYVDYSLGFLYEQALMHESRLPPIFIKKEAKRMKVDPVVSSASTTRKQKVKKDDMVNIPRSLFDRPSAALLKMRREAKLQKVKGFMVGATEMSKPVASFSNLKQSPIVVNKPSVDSHQDKPEWLVYEDWSTLQVIQDLQGLPLSLTVLLPAHIPNWDLVADFVNSLSRVYRSPRLCRIRYENIIVPREEGKILYDTNPKKQKKSKGIYKTKNNRPMKTSQLYLQDNNGSFTNLFLAKHKFISDARQKHKPVEKATFLQTTKNPKLTPVLVENGITYDQPLTAVQIATNRAERIAREKQKAQPVTQAAVLPSASQALTQEQLAAQRQVQQQQATVTVAGTSNLIQQQAQAVIASLAQAQQLQQAAQLTKANLQQGTVASVSLPKSLTSGIMVNATPGAAATGTFATISKALGQAGVASISAPTSVQNAAIAALTSTNLRNQRTAVTAVGTTSTMTVQEMVAAATAQVRGLTTTSGTTSTAPAVVSVAGLTAVQLQAATQRIPGTTLSPATTVASGAVNQINSQIATQRNITQLSQLQAIRQTQLLRQREQQTLKQQQQLKRLQTMQQQASQQATKVAVGSGTLTVAAAAQQRVAQQQVAMKQTVGRPMTEAEMAQLIKRQQQLQQQKQAQLTTAQILAQAQLQQVQQQQVSITGGTATLVKTVSASSLSGTSSVAIPVSAVTMGGVNINVSLPQGKTGVQTKGTTATITNQQLRQFQIQQQILNQARKGNKMTANLTQLAKVSSKNAAVAASSLSTPVNAVQIVQHNTQAGTTQQVKGLQTAMTVQQIQQAMKQVIPQNLPVVVTATPSVPGVQQQTTLRGEPSVLTGTVKPQTTTLPSTTLTTSGVLKGSPAVVVGQQQTATILQQVAASSSGLPQQAVTLAVRAAASQQGQQQVQIQVQQSPHSSLVSPQPQVVSASIQPSQARLQPISQNASTISIAQPMAVQNAAQASSVLSPSASLVQQVPTDSSIQAPTHVVMHNVSSPNSASALTIPAALSSSPTASTTAQVVQAAIQAARQQQQQAAQQQAQKASPYTMRLRNPPK